MVSSTATSKNFSSSSLIIAPSIATLRSASNPGIPFREISFSSYSSKISLSMLISTDTGSAFPASLFPAALAVPYCFDCAEAYLLALKVPASGFPESSVFLKILEIVFRDTFLIIPFSSSARRSFPSSVPARSFSFVMFSDSPAIIHHPFRFRSLNSPLLTATSPVLPRACKFFLWEGRCPLDYSTGGP